MRGTQRAQCRAQVDHRGRCLPAHAQVSDHLGQGVAVLVRFEDDVVTPRRATRGPHQVPDAHSAAPCGDRLGDGLTLDARDVDVDGREVGAQPADDGRHAAALRDQLMALLEGGHWHAGHAPVRDVEGEERARLEQERVEPTTRILCRVLLARSRGRCYRG
ncbi:hypothetical protein [Dermacoccus nishinomiyaensis]|uniref:hypothetical protein n=1 Tax=Dermacoccus nishinomiyaensis TaxID=1274 RepID=UPI003F4A49E3